MKLNAGCGTHYAEGWVNTDVWSSDTTRPDVKVTPGEPWPFDDDTFEAVYMGHVLEHMPWGDPVDEFLSEIRRVTKPYAPVLVVGPDVYRTISRWADGDEPWHMVASTLEHADRNFQPDRETEEWDGAPHYWNCHADRLKNLLTDAGFQNVADITDVVPDNFKALGENRRWWDDYGTKVRWPVVDKAPWQCALSCNA